MLRQRFLVAVIGLPLLIAAIWFGNPWFALFIAAIASLAGYEFYRMAGQAKTQPITYFGIVVILFLIISPCFTNAATKSFLITSAILISLIWLLFRSPREQAFHNWAWTMAGILYVGWTFSYWTDIMNLETGREWVFLAMFVVVANDTSAFFVGRSLGKRSMFPAVSPNKTWGGAVGGLLASVLFCLIFAIVFSLPVDYWQMVLLGCIISIFAQIGDLVESLLKRNAGVKDSSKLIPGHGGFLDRIDSYIFNGVVVYYCVVGMGL